MKIILWLSIYCYEALGVTIYIYSFVLLLLLLLHILKHVFHFSILVFVRSMFFLVHRELFCRHSSHFAFFFFMFWSGYATDSIIKVLQGKRIGTLFHQDAHLWTSVKEVGAREMAVAARECSRRLQVGRTVSSCSTKMSLLGSMFLHWRS